MLINRLLTWLTAIAMLVVPVGAAEAKTKYAKSEMDKAVGKCVGSVIGGALLGALVGRVVGGKNATVGGAGVGVAAGGIICAVLIANARHRDDIIEAQMAAAATPGRPVTASWTDDEGKPVTYTARATVASYDGARLVPIKYDYEGGKIESPVLPAGPADCRTVSGRASNGGNSPAQVVCRTPDGSYKLYGLPEA